MSRISSSAADVENMAAVARWVHFAENPDGLRGVVKHVQYFTTGQPLTSLQI